MDLDREEIILTIAIPTYNRAIFLERSLKSIISQACPNIEIIVSDNASTDNTAKIVENLNIYCKDLKIDYIKNEENLGSDYNFLQCYRRARGRFVLLMGDDDILIEDSLSPLLAFLREDGYGCDVIFLNHTSFYKDYKGLESCHEPFLKIVKSFTTFNKKIFMQYAQNQLTFMSAVVLSKNAFLTVSNPEKYNFTRFIHTCIAFEATKKNNSLLGVYASPVIAQETATENTSFFKNPEQIFYVFGNRMEQVYCEIGPRNNYDLKQMRRIYESAILNWRKEIILMKCKSNKAWKSAFKLYGWPTLKRHKRLWLKILPVVLVPDWIVRWVYLNIWQPLKQKKRKRF